MYYSSLTSSLPQIIIIFYINFVSFIIKINDNNYCVIITFLLSSTCLLLMYISELARK